MLAGAREFVYFRVGVLVERNRCERRSWRVSRGYEAGVLTAQKLADWCTDLCEGAGVLADAGRGDVWGIIQVNREG